MYQSVEINVLDFILSSALSIIRLLTDIQEQCSVASPGRRMVRAWDW